MWANRIVAAVVAFIRTTVISYSEKLFRPTTNNLDEIYTSVHERAVFVFAGDRH